MNPRFKSGTYAPHARTVAFEINRSLPSAYQDEILAEETRMARETLAPRGLDRRTVLVVGGAGYIGSVLTGHLLARGYRVRGLDCLVYNNELAVLPHLSHPDFEFVRCDLAERADFARALEGVSDVVLLAGLVGDPVTKKFPDAARRVNDDGHDLMLRLLGGRGLNKVVFVSTCSNYGLIEGDRLAGEDFALNPLSLYAQSKVRIEQKILALEGKADYAPTILRFATAFGLSPRMRFDLTVSEFARALFRGEDLLVYDAHTWRPYCHVQDFAEAIRRVLEAPRARVASSVFNAGGDANNCTKQMIVDAVLRELPAAKVRYQSHGADPRNYRVSFARIRERLHFEPAWSVADGVRELIGALRQGLFRDIATPASYYGNWEPVYPP